MELQDLFDGITSKVDEENKEKVSSLLKDIERRFTSLDEDLKSANSESKKRKLKIRELEEKNTDYELKIDSLSNNTEFEELKKQNEHLKTFQGKVYKQERDFFINTFDAVAKHPNFEKIKDKIKLPEKDGDKFKFNELPDEAILENNSKLREWNELGLFETKNTKTPMTPLAGQTALEDDDIDIEALALKNPDEAKKWLAARGLGV